jgi:hypothetical protein
METTELFALIRSRCEVEEIMELADIGVDELMLRFRGHILDHRERFEDYLDLYEGGFHDE